MSNAKKILEKATAKKAREPRIRKINVDIESLGDAILDGKLVVPVKGKLVFVRKLDGKTVIHKGHVFSYDEATGDVVVWDETRSQSWGFNAVRDAGRITCKVFNDGPKTS